MSDKNADYMKSFREARKDMGFTQTSAYIPHSRLNDFSRFVERLKAERMLEICETCSPTSRARTALARRNAVDAPSPETVRAYVKGYENQKAMKAIAAECINHSDLANGAANAGRLAESEADQVKWASLWIAHNQMTYVLWRELTGHGSRLQETNDAA